jgi:hypothetical protein
VRATSQPRDLTVLGIAGLLILLLTVIRGLVASPDPTQGDSGSSYVPGLGGAKAAFVLLQRLGFDVVRSIEPLALLRGDPARTVLVLASPSQPPSEQDAKALRRFLDAGGVLLATGESSIDFLPDVVGHRREGQEDTKQTYTPVIPSPLARNAPRITMPALLPGVSGARYVAVYADAKGPAVLAARFGKGQVIWWGSSDPLLNRSIADPGHVELLMNAVGPVGGRRVLWDEHYHGHARSFWSYVAGTPLAPAFAQIALMVLAAAVTYSLRRGPLRSVPDDPRTDPLEFVDTMGALYARAGAANAAVSVARSHARRALLSSTGLPATSTDARLAEAVAVRFARDAGSLSELLARSDAAIEHRLSDDRALVLVQELQEITRLPQTMRRSQAATNR